MTILGTAFGLLRAEQARRAMVPDPAQVSRLRARLEGRARFRPGRPLALLHVETGCCGACAATLDELRLGRLAAGAFGLGFVAHPNEADVLLVTGLAVRNAASALSQAWQAMGPTAIAVAVGDCAAGSPIGDPAPYAASTGGVARVLPVDLAIRGAPPAPDAILLGLLTLRDAVSVPRHEKQVEGQRRGA